MKAWAGKPWGRAFDRDWAGDAAERAGFTLCIKMQAAAIPVQRSKHGLSHELLNRNVDGQGCASILATSTR